MSEYIEVGQPLQFTDPNTPTRVGEIVENVSDIYNIPSPRLGMQVFVKSEKKNFVITSLKNKIINGVDVPEAAVEAFEAVGAKSITWNNDTNPSNMNDFVVAGVYDIKGERTRANDNLPILNTGGGHSFNARLTVLDSSISGSGNSDDKCITQVLSFNNRLGQGEVYIRTGKGASLDSLTWEKWSTLQRNVNVNQVNSLDGLIDNGIYSGILSTTGETFVLVVINNYAIAGNSLPRSISQFKYSVNPNGVVSFGKRVKVSDNAFPADWEILNYEEINSMISENINNVIEYTNDAIEGAVLKVKKDILEGIEPDKIDSIKDIVAWIEAHGGDVELMQEVTYSELVALRDNANFVPGMKYRITDYVTTTVQQDTKSANHPFDVIVEAVSENELSELAQAIQHEGDTYFDGNNISAWQLWYDLDNNTDKYEWADAENGKGVIYRMIDEKRNDCPYDFKNILFYTRNYVSDTTSDKYYYTFSYVVNGVLYDGTIEKRVTRCHNNSMGVYTSSVKSILNGNIFRNTSFGNSCYSNTFGDSCHSNTFGDSCYYNTFGNYCHSNTFWNYCNSNTFGNSCYSNTFRGYCYSNTFGDGCSSNTFGNSCYSNTFRGYCYYNTFGDSCYYNTFGNSCYSNTFGNSCCSNTFGDNTSDRKLDSDHTSITLNEEYYDDGTNTLVPIKHPDLSTQPSILPYKFMGQYVYEQLIPNIEITNSYDIQNTFAVKKPLIISADSIGGNAGENASPHWWIDENTFNIEIFSVADFENVKFFRIVYTSMPEEGDYGYNNY